MEELFALGKAYPIVSVAIAGILFLIGFRIAKKILWPLAIIAIIIAIIMIFL